MYDMVEFSHLLAMKHLHKQAIAVDMTCGNGYDTLFLATHAMRVYGFDIQPQAIEHTKTLLEQHSITNTSLILDSHEYLINYTQEPLDVVLFNLGYLPKGDKTITTTTSSTLPAINSALSVLSKMGIIILVVYPGHPEGMLESIAINHFLSSLSPDDFLVVRYGYMNQPTNPPYVCAIQKKTK